MNNPKIRIISRSSNIALDWIARLFYNQEFESSGFIEYRDFADKKVSSKDIGGCRVEVKKLIDTLVNLEPSASTDISEDIRRAISWCQSNLKNENVILRRDHYEIISD